MCDPPHACNGKIPTLKKDLERKLQGLPSPERQREVKDQEMVLLKENQKKKKNTFTHSISTIFFLFIIINVYLRTCVVTTVGYCLCALL